MLALLAWLALFSMSSLALDPSKDFHHYVRDTWSIEQGLPQISALTIAQDAQGYIWVGTQAGLARFDGNRFVAFTPATTPELPGVYVSDLLHDPAGRLWIATYKGLAVREQGRFASVPWLVDGVAQPLNVLALAVTDEGAILAAAGDAVFAVEGGQLVQRHPLPRAASTLMIRNDVLWVGSLGGVFRIAADGASEFLPLPEAARSAVVTQLLDAQGRIWAGTSQGLFHLQSEHLQGGQWQRYAESDSLATAPIEAMFEDADGNLWVGDIAHLSRFRDSMPHERIEVQGAGMSIRAVFEDREGNLWLGSQWNGLTRLRNGWTRRFSLREGLHTPLLWSVANGADGALWVGTDEGLSLFRDGTFELKVPSADLPHPNAYTLFIEGTTVWIGTRRGLAIYRDGALVPSPEFAAMSSAQINGILRDRRGALWFATTEGLFRQSGQRLEQFGTAHGLIDRRVRFMLEAEDGSLLLGTHAGLFVFGEDGLAPVGLDRGLPAGLDVTVIHALPKGRLMLGTLAEELYLYDGSRWTRFGADQGFSPNAPFFLAHDAVYLWVAGIRGIQRAPLLDLFAVAAGHAEKIGGQMLLNERGDQRGGQKGFCCNGAGNAKGLQLGGQLWAPTRDGLVVLDTRDVRLLMRPPTTLVERLRIGGRWRDANPANGWADGAESALLLDANDNPVLAPDARDLGFEFTGITFGDPRSVTFRYRLLGYHDDWREPDEAGQRVVSYTNLGPGAYVFEVQASISEDAWSEPAQMVFSIQPYFNETGLFNFLLALLVLMLLLMLGFVGYRLQQRRYALRSEALERLVRQRTAALGHANLRLQEASQTDPLTGLRNRRYLAMQIPKDLSFYGRELRRDGPRGGHVIVFALVDIDHFKRINDDHGHAVGDHVLVQFAEVLLRLVRSGDYVARWGGEEFVLVFRPTPPNQLPMLGERIRAAVEAEVFDPTGPHPLSLTCSIGLVEYPTECSANHTLGWEQLIELADRALYHVKRNGRNGWAAYRPAPGMDAARVLELLRNSDQELAESAELELISGGGVRDAGVDGAAEPVGAAAPGIGVG